MSSTKNTQQRRRVMSRSIALGHCVCNPKQPCPCPTLQNEDICPCAGERLPSPPPGHIRLTQLVDKPGCASKIDQTSLRSILGGLPSFNDPRVLIGMPAGDDAGVYQLSNDQALVQTVDVFTPCVDDPYTFGQIAAANSLSDIYAMGGRPICALSVVGFPIRELPGDILHEILRGGIEQMRQAGVPVIGGHSIDDTQIKAGFAVTGLIHPNRIADNAGAKPGDVLVLTKPIGTGIISFAAQIGRAAATALDAAARSMTTLNQIASELMMDAGAHACTDITGFGLMGHLTNLSRSSGVDIEVVWDDIPLLPGVMECVAQGILPGGVERNRESSQNQVTLDAGVDPLMFDVCCDPQTSGGLLIALPPADATRLLARLAEAGIPEATVIGTAVTKGPGRITLRTRGTRRLKTEAALQACSSSRVGQTLDSVIRTEQENDPMSCCEHGNSDGKPGPAVGATSEIQQAFQEFMKKANAPGALDRNTKQAIAIALSVMTRCEPCLKAQLKKARDAGMTAEQIDEAAWMAIAFGGGPVMMFYNQAKKG